MDNCILLIDDSDLDNFINRKIIESAGLNGQVFEFQSAVDALEFLNELSVSQSLSPSFIFLDVNMPVMDGFGFLREFGHIAESFNKKPTVIVVSSSVDRQESESLLAHPLVSGFISKPLTKEKLGLILNAAGFDCSEDLA